MQLTPPTVPINYLTSNRTDAFAVFCRPHRGQCQAAVRRHQHRAERRRGRLAQSRHKAGLTLRGAPVAALLGGAAATAAQRIDTALGRGQRLGRCWTAGRGCGGRGRKTGRRYRGHVYRCGARNRGAAIQRQDPHDPPGARAGGTRSYRRRVARSRARAFRSVDHHPRHDIGDQCDHRAQRRQDRARDHRRVSRHDRDPAREPVRAIRRQYRPAAAAGAAAIALSSARAHRRAWPSACPPRRGRAVLAGGASCIPGRPVGRDRFPAQLYEPGA